MDTLWLIITIGAGLILSAFFSGMETGLISLNKVRLRHEVERKHRQAIIVNGFVENTDRLLGTTLAGSNLCNVVIAVASSALAVRWWGPGFAIDLTTMLVSAVVVLVVAELTPKLLFRQYAHRLCFTFADVLNAMAWLLAPLVWFLGVLMRLLARLSDRGGEQPASFFVTREELKHLAKEGEAGGALTAEERQMIHGVIDFPYKTVHEIMVPLARTVTVAPATDVAALFDVSQRTGYARLPVRLGDRIIGVANVYEILFTGVRPDGQTVEAVMQKPQCVLSTDRINRVLPVLRASRNPMCIVVNPDGRAIGIITVEDIVEEIVGDVEG
ncbi:MAG: CNNM domain-containing protein [Verrucomicrobiota bacterium]|jgi:putative hemolysin